MMPISKVRARPTHWKHNEELDQWEDETYGFCVWVDDGYTPARAFVSWDVGAAAAMLKGRPDLLDQKWFHSLLEAQEWCQAQVDDWIAAHVVLTPGET